jgi:MFS transporter, DHA1 family, multidrug resistance protein
VAFWVAAGFGVVAPAIPVFARSFGVSRTAAAAVISAFALMRLVSALGVGRLVNRVGGRLVLGVGIALVAGSSALAGLARDYVQLLVLRGVGGIGSAMFSVSAMTVLLGATRSEQRGRAVGAFSGGFLLGGIAGPAFGGLITSWSLRAPFFIYAATLAAAGSIGLILLPRAARGQSAEHAEQTPALSIWAALQLPAFRAAAFANLADNWAAIGVRSAIVPLFVLEVLREPAVWTGIGFTAFTIANLVTLVVGGRLTDRRGRRPALLVGCLVSAAGALLLTLPPSLPLLIGALTVFGFGSGFLDVAPGAMMGDVVGRRSGTVVAGYQIAGDLGSLAGPLIAGILADHAGFNTAFAVTAAVLVAAAIVAVRAPETLVRPTTADPGGRGETRGIHTS